MSFNEKEFDVRALMAQARFGRKKSVSSRNGTVVTSHPITAQIALDILNDGGNAVDAYIAASLAHTVVEPTMTSVTSTFFLQYYDSATKQVCVLDAGCNAPKALPFSTINEWDTQAASAMKDGRGATVPGFWAGIQAAYERYGVTPLKKLCAPSITLAREGFEPDDLIWGMLFLSQDDLAEAEQSREIYMPNGTLIQKGDLLIQRRAADLLEKLSEEGNQYFYHGDFAEAYVRKVREFGGWLTRDDLSSYEVKWLEPSRSTYHEYELCAAGTTPFAGELFCEIFKALESIGLRNLGPAANSAEAAWRMKQIIRQVTLEHVDWNHNGGRPDFSERISKEFTGKRIASLPDVGLPKFAPNRSGSVQLTVSDKDGNVATGLHTPITGSLTPLYVEGVRIPAMSAIYSQGMPKPGGRINLRAGTCMFFQDGKMKLAGGSPSVSTVDGTIQNVSNILDFDMSLEESVHAPRFGAELDPSRPEVFMVESDMPMHTFTFFDKKELPYLKVCPWNWKNGSFNAISFDSSGMATSCGDPRRLGKALAV